LILETERLRLRPHMVDDFDDLHALPPLRKCAAT
jgi:hypothetical protein